jgi:starch synthase (maltosyl-transferring)
LEAKNPHQSWFVNALRTIRAVWRLYWLLRHKQIRTIETLTHFSNILGIFIAWLAGVPVRISSQRNLLFGFPRWFLRLDAWLANSNLVDKMVAVSEQTWQFCVAVEGMNPQKIVVIPNGINPEEFDKFQWSTPELNDLRGALGIAANKRVAITVARLHPQKGHVFLIQAASLILAKCSDVTFLLVGDGEERAVIEQRIEGMGLANHFRLLGARSDVPKLLALSDLFVLPSLYEGMPNVILEAMASRLPVVATDVDGTREVVIDRETGLLVPRADSKALGNAILLLLKDETMRCQMGMKGYERARTQFSEHVMCRRYEELIFSSMKKVDHGARMQPNPVC